MSQFPVRVAVVIPLYKPQPTPNEQVALRQCVRVLGHYPICLAVPRSLDVSVYQNLHPSLVVLPFDDGYFTDIQAYNRLMLSVEFYDAFADFEYVLIHQLDAFVFRDELGDWCSRGYDYIGAPWLRDRDFSSRPEAAWFRLKQRVATVLGLKKADGVTPREIITLNAVGNGGLSLRRVPAMRRWARLFRGRIAQYERMTGHQYNEDVFWGVEVNRFWPFLRIPDYRTALRFAVEFYPQRAIETYNGGRLPFGCHAWNIHGTEYWRPIFARYGYEINP